MGLDHGRFAQAALAGSLILWLLLGGPWRLGRADIGRVIGGAADLGDADDRPDRALRLSFRIHRYRRPRHRRTRTRPTCRSARAAKSIIGRRLGGEFVVAGKVNNVPASFLFDTGASTVVIRAQDAKKMGIDTATLDYDVRVTTANGAAMAAETRLDQLSVGPIVIRNVRALIAKPGALSENLLGMSFLERLDSYSVERGRLVLKARRSGLSAVIRARRASLSGLSQCGSSATSAKRASRERRTSPAKHGDCASLTQHFKSRPPAAPASRASAPAGRRRRRTGPACGRRHVVQPHAALKARAI